MKINQKTKTVSVFLLILGAFLMVTTSCSGSQEESASKTVLRVGSEVGYPPFEEIGGASGDEVVGFDPDILAFIAEAGGFELQIEDMKFTTLIPALEAGKIDLISSAMTITEDRAKSVDFSDPYFTASQMAIVQKDNDTITSLADLENAIIGVQLGTTGNKVASENSSSESNIVSFSASFEAIADLKAGRVDLVIVDDAPGKVFLSLNPDLKAVPTIKFAEEYYGFAVQKGNSELLTIVNDTIAKIKADGTYDKLIEKYFSN